MGKMGWCKILRKFKHFVGGVDVDSELFDEHRDGAVVAALASSNEWGAPFLRK
jgi:hypothetical protein